MDRDLNLVTVFESNDTFAIGLAKASLEDAGVPFWMDYDETSARLVLGPVMFPLCRLLVPPERETEARALLDVLAFPIEEGAAPGGDGEDTA